MVLTVLAPVHEAAASAPLRKVSTTGAKAAAPRTKRRRRWSASKGIPEPLVSPFAAANSVDFGACSIASVFSIAIAPINYIPADQSGFCQSLHFVNLANRRVSIGKNPAPPGLREARDLRPANQTIHRSILAYSRLHVRETSRNNSRSCQRSREPPYQPLAFQCQIILRTTTSKFHTIFQHSKQVHYKSMD
ncbi:MAG: hypothetical protein JNK92_13035 [Dechloromonas sp.]|nr:hypothetical protein [Dechloromonas sp.]